MFRKDMDETAPIDINQLIRSVLGLVYVDLRKHGIETRISLLEGLPPVLGNEVQLQQVLLNLMMNAIEAMASGEPRVMSVRSVFVGRDIVRVSVEDTGSGIDPADVERIFTPLFTTKTRGMGVGLSICADRSSSGTRGRSGRHRLPTRARFLSSTSRLASARSKATTLRLERATFHPPRRRFSAAAA